jgi:hypothetical protein
MQLLLAMDKVMRLAFWCKGYYKRGVLGNWFFLRFFFSYYFTPIFLMSPFNLKSPKQRPYSVMDMFYSTIISHKPSILLL